MLLFSKLQLGGGLKKVGYGFPVYYSIVICQAAAVVNVSLIDSHGCPPF